MGVGQKWARPAGVPPCDAADVQSDRVKEPGVGCVWRFAGRTPEPARTPCRSGDGAGRALGVGSKHLPKQIYIYINIHIYI